MLKRSELSARRLSRPRARSTYEGSRVSELQAAPVDTASPASPAIRLSPSTPPKETLRMPGTRAAPAPLRCTSPRAARPSHSRSRSRPSRACFARAAPGAPARRPARSLRSGGSAGCRDADPRSCPPPKLTGRSEPLRVPRHVQRTDPLRPAQLVCREGQQVHRQAAHVQRHLARRLGAVGVKGDAALAAHRTQGGDVLQHAGLVVGVHHRDQQRVGAQRGCERGRLEQPAACRA